MPKESAEPKLSFNPQDAKSEKDRKQAVTGIAQAQKLLGDHNLAKSDSIHPTAESDVTHTTPNFHSEWDEAVRYPEFAKLGKDRWAKLAATGKPMPITQENVGKINNTDAADPSSFGQLDPDKQQRVLSQIKSGTVEMPIVARYSDGRLELVGGNTRLTALMARHGKAKVWAFDVPAKTPLAKGEDDVWVGGWQQPLSKAYKAPGVAEHEMFVQPVEDHLFHPNTDPEIRQMAQGALVHPKHSKQKVKDVDAINVDDSFKVQDKELFAKRQTRYQQPMAEFIVPELAHKLGLGDNFQARVGHVNLKHNDSGTVHEPHEENEAQTAGKRPNDIRSLTLSKWIPIDHLPDLSKTKKHNPAKGKFAFKETPENLHKLFLFDLLIQNDDRHGYNYGVDKNGRLQMIDHGLTMRNMSPNSVMPQYMDDSGFDWDSKAHPEAIKWLQSINPDELHEFMLSHDHPDLLPQDRADLHRMAKFTKLKLEDMQKRAVAPGAILRRFKF